MSAPFDRAAAVRASRPPAKPTPGRPADPVRTAVVEQRTAKFPFEIVDLPDPPQGPGRPPPFEREQLVEFAVENPGRWIRYSPEHDTAKPAGLVDAARKARSGFPKGFQAVVRDGFLHVRYDEPEAEGE